jgi:hypothetical protein
MALMLTSAIAGPAWAETLGGGFDVRPSAAGGKIVTGGVSDATGDTVAGQRVFGFDFGSDDPSQPFFTQDPGFNALVGSGLQAGALSFDVLGPSTGSALPYNLSYWDGTGNVSWSAAPSGEQLQWNRGASNLFVGSTTNALVSGYTIGTVAGAGNIHIHLNAFLNGSDGNSIPAGPGDWGAGDGVQAAEGVYALSIVLKNGTLGNSNPIWIVYTTSGMPDGVGDTAMAWLNAHAVPEPSSSLLCGVGGAFLACAGRRARLRSQAGAQGV